MTLKEVITEIDRADTAGAWRLNKQWEVIINSLDSSEIASLLAVVEKMHSEAPRTALRNALFSRWGETDPAAAMARALSLPEESLRTSARGLVLQGWAYANPAEVVAWARQLPDGPLKTEATNAANTGSMNLQSGAVVIVLPGAGTSTEAPNHFAQAAAADVKAAIAEAARRPDSFTRIQAYNAIAKVWAAQAPAAAMQWALTLRDGNEYGNERSVVGANISRDWARQSPRDANAFIATVPDDTNRKSWLVDTFKTWRERDFNAALAWAQKIPDAELKKWLLGSLIEPWLQQSPDAVAEFLLSLPPGDYAFTSGMEKLAARSAGTDGRLMENFLRRMTPEQRASQAFTSAISTWIQSAPDRAYPVVLDLCSGSQRIDFASRALTQLARRDVAAAQRRIEALPDGADRTQILRAVLVNVANGNALSSTDVKQNSGFAFWLLGIMPAAVISPEGMPGVVGSLARIDLQATLSWAKTLPAGAAKNSVLQQVVRQLNEIDPANAWKEVIAWPPGQYRSDIVVEIASRLAMKDPAQALQLITAIEDLSLRASAVRGLVQVMARSNPVAVIPAVMSLPVSETRAALVSDVVQNWAQADAAGAVHWAEAQTTPELRAVALGAAIAGMSGYSVTEAAALLEKIPPGERLDRAVGQVCDTWCRNDPPSAARWAAGLPPGRVRELALPRVAGPYARVDYAAAASWLQDMPRGGDRDRAIQAFLSLGTSERAAELAAWVDKIDDAEIRFTAIEMIGRLWLRSDATAANRWLATTDLPAERRSRLRPASGEYYR